MTKEATQNKLSAFARLRKGWHYGSGMPPSASSLRRAQCVLDTYDVAGVRETDAFCGQDGEVMVTAYPDGHYIECDIASETTMRFLHEDGQRQLRAKAHVSSMDDLILYIRKAVQEALGTPWRSSVSSILQTMTVDGMNLRTMFSKIPARMVEHRFLSSNVQSGYLSTSAPTSGGFTERLGESHRRFGFSNYGTFSQAPAAGLVAGRKPPSRATNVIITSRVRATAISEGSQKSGNSMISGYAPTAA